MLSSHMLHEVEICNRVAIIDQGKMLYQGTIDDLIGKDKIVKIRVNQPDRACELMAADPALSVTRNGDQSLYVRTSEEQTPRINAMLVKHGLDVTELSPRSETLEEVFLRLTKPKVATDRYI